MEITVFGILTPSSSCFLGDWRAAVSSIDWTSALHFPLRERQYLCPSQFGNYPSKAPDRLYGFRLANRGSKECRNNIGLLHPSRLRTCRYGQRSPIALDNVVVDRHPAFFELFPTSKGTAHAAIILPSRHYKTERSLQKELSFIITQSHYSKHIASRQQQWKALFRGGTRWTPPPPSTGPNCIFR